MTFVSYVRKWLALGALREDRVECFVDVDVLGRIKVFAVRKPLPEGELVLVEGPDTVACSLKVPPLGFVFGSDDEGELYVLSQLCGFFLRVRGWLPMPDRFWAE